MEDEPSGIAAELRAAENRPSLLVFVLVTIVGSLVVATGIRVEGVGNVVNPLPRLLIALGSDLADQDEQVPLRAVQAGQSLRPAARLPGPAPTQRPVRAGSSVPVPLAPPVPDGRGGRDESREQGPAGDGPRGNGSGGSGPGSGPGGNGNGGNGNGNGGSTGGGNGNGNAGGNGNGNGNAGGNGNGNGR